MTLRPVLTQNCSWDALEGKSRLRLCRRRGHDSSSHLLESYLSPTVVTCVIVYSDDGRNTPNSIVRPSVIGHFRLPRHAYGTVFLGISQLHLLSLYFLVASRLTCSLFLFLDLYSSVQCLRDDFVILDTKIVIHSWRIDHASGKEQCRIIESSCCTNNGWMYLFASYCGL